MKKLENYIIKNKIHCYFVSPHLDDAILSCGNLLYRLSGKTNITVINVFTKAGKKPLTLSAKKLLKLSGYDSPEQLYEKRREEDARAFAKLGICPINLNLEDGIWRKRKTNFITNILCTILPELIYIYPTYYLHLVSGKVSRADVNTLQQLEKKLKLLINKKQKHIIFCPMGIGKHVDHVIVNDVVSSMFNGKVIFWSDFPYNIQHKLDKSMLKKLLKYTMHIKNNIKSKLILEYESQVKSMFKNNSIPNVNENYYINK